MRPPLNPTEKPNPDLSGIKKVILIRLRRIGDIVMTTPAITALRKGLPSAHISYVVEMLYRELIEGNPHLDKAIVLPRPLGAKNFWNTVRKIGYKIKYKSFVYDFKLPRGIKTGHLHSVENHINLVKALGIEVPVPPPLLLPEPSESEKKKIHKFFSDNNREGSKVVVLHIGAGNEFREWGISNWIKLVFILLKKQTVKIVMIGASEDAGIAGLAIKGTATQVTFGACGRSLPKKSMPPAPDFSELFI